MNIKELEEQAESHAQQVLTLIEGGRHEEMRLIVDSLNRTELAWLVLSLASGLLTQESENGRLHVQLGILRQQNEMFDTANANLFREKRELLDKNAELRELINSRAAAADPGRGRLVA